MNNKELLEIAQRLKSYSKDLKNVGSYGLSIGDIADKLIEHVKEVR